MVHSPNYTKIEKWAFASIFFVPALLLSTDNGSVAIVGLTLLFSCFAIYKNRSTIGWDKTDKIVVLCLSAYLLANVPLVIADWDNFRYFRGASRIILCIPIYFCFKYVVDIKKLYTRAISLGLLVGSVGAFTLACYQFFIEGRPRVDGFLYSINFGYLACAMTVLAFSMLKNDHNRNILVVAILLSLFSLISTLSRGAIIALPMVLCFAYIINFRKIGARFGLAGVLLVLIFSLGTYTLSDSIRDRVHYTITELTHIAHGNVESATSSGGRLILWRAAIEAFQQNPMFGLTHPERESLNVQLNKEGVINDWAAGVPRGHAHSQYFDLLASGGILGIIALIFMLVVPFFYFFRYHQQSQAAYTGTLFVAAFAIFCLTEVALQQNLISSFYGYMLALLFAATQLEVKHKERSHNEFNSETQK